MAEKSPKEASTAEFAEYTTKHTSVFGAGFQGIEDSGSSYEAQYQCLMTQDDRVNSSGSASPPRKRNKVDKDGFLTPLTPDSSQSSSKETECHPDDQHNQGETAEEAEHDADKSQHDDTEYTRSTTSYEHASHEQEGSPEKTHLPLAELFTELNEKARKEMEHWEKCFMDSENFEVFCLTRLDSLLAEAKALEQNLLEQKEQLRQRLAGLSMTLRASVDQDELP